MRTLHRPRGSRIARTDPWKTSAYAFVPGDTHFGELCGFADDVVAPGHGFGMHPHREMEISTIVLAGAQRHEDSTGGRFLLGVNAVQTMSAGTGIRHSEANASETEPFHSLQIWVYPRHPGGGARFETFTYAPDDARNRCLLALSPDRRDGSALIGQDAFLSVATFELGEGTHYRMYLPGNGVYVHCARGSVAVAGVPLSEADAVGLWAVEGCDVEAVASAELVLVEVPMTRGVRG